MVDLYYIEDDPDIACAVKEYLEHKNFRVTVCATLAQARQALQIRVPALVLLDWNMPDGRGDGLCRWIRGNWKELPVIFLTVRGDSRDIVAGFRNGADDYVVKPFELEVLYSRIQALLRRTGNVAKRYLSCDRIMVDVNRRAVFCYREEMPDGNTAISSGLHVTVDDKKEIADDYVSMPSGRKEETPSGYTSMPSDRKEETPREIALSAAEYQLLLYLMENKGKTVTREKILEQVWDVNGSYVNNNTLTVTMKRLRDKLGQPACLKTVRSVGYRMEDTI